MNDQHRGRAADPHTHTETTETTGTDTTAGIAAARVGHREAARGRVHHTGDHPQGGVALARTIEEAQQRLTDMLLFCDPAAGGDSRHRRLLPAPYRPVLPRDPSPTCTQCNTGAPDCTVIARPLTSLSLEDR